MRYLKWLLLVLSFLFLTGCYNKKELDNLAYVIAIGADEGEKQDLSITYQVAIPIKIAGEGNEIGKGTYTSYTVSAPSIYVANAKVNALTSKEINLSHLKLILYGEELAKNDLSGHINSLISNIAIRPKTSIAICKGKAEDFLNQVTPILETSPARYYDLALSSFQYASESAETDIIDFYTAAQSPFKDAVAVVASLEGEEAQFRGLAAFSGGKMVGEISPEMTIGHLIATNSLTNGTIYVPDVLEKNKTVSVLLKQRGNCKIKVFLEENIPKVNIVVKMNANLGSFTSNTDYLDKNNANKLQQEIEDELRKILLDYLTHTSAIGSDIAGIGRFAKSNFLTYPEFENIHWKEIFPNAQFDVLAQVSLNVAKITFHKLPNQ